MHTNKGNLCPVVSLKLNSCTVLVVSCWLTPRSVVKETCLLSNMALNLMVFGHVFPHMHKPKSTEVRNKSALEDITNTEITVSEGTNAELTGQYGSHGTKVGK